MNAQPQDSDTAHSEGAAIPPADPQPQKRPAGSTVSLLRKFLFGLLLLTLAVGFHALLFMGVRVPAVSEAPPKTEQGGQSILLPPPTAAGDLQDQLQIYARIFDPTLLIKPHSNRGFSSILSRARQSPVTPPPELETLTDLTAERSLQGPKLTAASAALAAQVQSIWPPPQPRPIQSPPPQKVNPNVLWHTPEGIPLPELPAHTAAEIRQHAGKAVPEHPSRIRIDREGAVLRLRLEQSSGIQALDNLAIRDLRTALRPLLMNPEGKTEAVANIPEALQPPPNATVVVEAEWRLLLAQADIEEDGE